MHTEHNAAPDLMTQNTIPVLGLAGWSGSGKTTLITRLIPLLTDMGIQTAVIKHDVHGLSGDETGKDSERFRQAGAVACILCGPGGPELPEAIRAAAKALLPSKGLILVEGFKNADLPQIGLARFSAGIPLTAPASGFLALVSDRPVPEADIPCFCPEETDRIAAWIREHFLGHT